MINICTEEKNVLQVLSGVDHRKKRTQIKERKHKLNFDENLHSVKRVRIKAEDETKKNVEGSNKGGIASANDNNGENMASDNVCVLNKFHLTTNNILSSNSIETKGDFSHGNMSSIFMERCMCFPPKDNKYCLRSSLLSDEASLPPSKRRHQD